MKKFMEASADGKHIVFNILGIKAKFKMPFPQNKQFLKESALKKIEQLQKNGNEVVVDEADIHKIVFKFDDCHNNKIVIGKLAESTQGILTIDLYCDNSEIIIGKGLKVQAGGSLYIHLGKNGPPEYIKKVKNVKFKIGEECVFVETYIVTVNSNTTIEIGDDCMFSTRIGIVNTDYHPVYSITSDKIINPVKTLKIGDHCWVGAYVSILKNSPMADGCILGWKATVAGKFLEPNCAIAGNLARIIKRDVRWAFKDSRYIHNEEVIECGT